MVQTIKTYVECHKIINARFQRQSTIDHVIKKKIFQEKNQFWTYLTETMQYIVINFTFKIVGCLFKLYVQIELYLYLTNVGKFALIPLSYVTCHGTFNNFDRALKFNVTRKLLATPLC